MDRSRWESLTDKQKQIMIRLVYTGHCLVTESGAEFCVLDDKPERERRDTGPESTVPTEEMEALEALGLVEQNTMGWEPTRLGRRLVMTYGG